MWWHKQYGNGYHHRKLICIVLLSIIASLRQHTSFVVIEPLADHVTGIIHTREDLLWGQATSECTINTFISKTGRYVGAYQPSGIPFYPICQLSWGVFCESKCRRGFRTVCRYFKWVRIVAWSCIWWSTFHYEGHACFWKCQIYVDSCFWNRCQLFPPCWSVMWRISGYFLQIFLVRVLAIIWIDLDKRQVFARVNWTSL